MYLQKPAALYSPEHPVLCGRYILPAEWGAAPERQGMDSDILPEDNYFQKEVQFRRQDRECLR